MGVFAPLVGIIGTMQAAEALKLLAASAARWPGGCRCWTARTMEWTDPHAASASERLPACGRRR